MTTAARARAILERDVLGTDEVARRLGIRFTADQSARLGEVPFSETVLA